MIFWTFMGCAYNAKYAPFMQDWYPSYSLSFSCKNYLCLNWWLHLLSEKILIIPILHELKWLLMICVWIYASMILIVLHSKHILHKTWFMRTMNIFHLSFLLMYIMLRFCDYGAKILKWLLLSLPICFLTIGILNKCLTIGINVLISLLFNNWYQKHLIVKIDFHCA